MSFGEEYSSTFLVEVAGTALPDDLASMLVFARVDDSTNVPDLFVLRFSDVAGTFLSRSGIEIGTSMAISVKQNGPRGAIPIIVGEVTTVEREVGVQGLITVVRGYDHSHRLFRGTRVAAYIDSTAGDIVRTVVKRAGLKVGNIATQGPVMSHVSQDGVNDWEFLRRLAARVGAILTVNKGAIDFGPPTEASAAPASGGGAREDPFVLQQGVNVLGLRATLTSAGQVPDVEVRGWSVEDKREVVAVAQTRTTNAVLPDADPATLARVFDSPRYVAPVPTLNQPAQYEAAAAALSAHLAGGFAELDGTLRGNPAIRAGAAIMLSGFGAPFDGRYAVSTSSHSVSSDGGYLTDFTVSNASDRSLYGVMSGGAGPGGASTDATANLSGVVTAVVTATNDPVGLGRVKVMFPQLSDDYESWWVRTVQAGAGKGRGAVILPEVGDEVLVAFEQGSVGRPYVLGGVYNGVDQPDKPWSDHVGETDGAITRRSFTSRSGMLIEFIESSSSERVTISTNDGEQRVTLVQSGARGVEIVAQGPVNVTAQGDASVTSETGDILMTANRVRIEAKTGLELAGATVSVKGSTSAELSANGTTTVRGATVRIN